MKGMANGKWQMANGNRMGLRVFLRFNLVGAIALSCSLALSHC